MSLKLMLPPQLPSDPKAYLQQYKEGATKALQTGESQNGMPVHVDQWIGRIEQFAAITREESPRRMLGAGTSARRRAVRCNGQDRIRVRHDPPGCDRSLGAPAIGRERLAVASRNSEARAPPIVDQQGQHLALRLRESATHRALAEHSLVRTYGVKPRVTSEHPAAIATATALRTVARGIKLPGDIDGWINRLNQAATSEHARRDLLACLPGPARQGVMATSAKNLAAFDAAVSACVKFQSESVANAKVQARTDPDFHEIIDIRETQLGSLKDAAAAARKLI